MNAAPCGGEFCVIESCVCDYGATATLDHLCYQVNVAAEDLLWAESAGRPPEYIAKAREAYSAAQDAYEAAYTDEHGDPDRWDFPGEY